MRSKKLTANVLDYPRQGLCPDVWDDSGQIKPDIRDDIMAKISEFVGDERWVVGYRILGSLTSWQYNSKSDLDVHITVDWDQLKSEYPGLSKDELEDVLDAYRDEMRDQKWKVPNTDHPLEISFETPYREPVETDGVYNLMTDNWDKEPRSIDADFDPESVYSSIIDDAEAIAQELDLTIGNVKRDLQNIESLQEAITTMDPSDRAKFQKRIQERMDELEKELVTVMETAQDVSDNRDQDYEADSEANINFKYLQKFGYIWLWKNLEKLMGEVDEVTPELAPEDLPKVKEVIDEGWCEMDDKRAFLPSKPSAWLKTAQEPGTPKTIDTKPKTIERGEPPPTPPVDKVVDKMTPKTKAPVTDKNEEAPDSMQPEPKPASIDTDNPAKRWEEDVKTNVQKVLPDLVPEYLGLEWTLYKPNLIVTKLDEDKGFVYADLVVELINKSNGIKDGELKLTLSANIESGISYEPKGQEPWESLADVDISIEDMKKWAGQSQFGFIGTCVDILEDPASPFGDATEMAQVVENGVEVRPQEFKTMVGDMGAVPAGKDVSFWKAEDASLAWAYDGTQDIHYFFGRTASGIEFTDRYKAMGIDYPDPETVCKGQCEGTGMIPVEANDPDTVLKKLWDEAESNKPADDGWHFVKCPDCGGTGKAVKAAVEPIPTKVVCAWCGKHLSGDPKVERTSHGMCEDCEKKVNDEIDASEAEAKRTEAAISLQPIYVSNRILEMLSLDKVKEMDSEAVQHEIYTWLSRNQLKYTKEDVRKIHDQLAKQTGIEPPPPKEPKPDEEKPVLPPTPVEDITQPPKLSPAPEPEVEEAIVPGQEPVIKTPVEAPTPRPVPKIIGRMMVTKTANGWAVAAPVVDTDALLKEYSELVRKHPAWKTARYDKERKVFSWILSKCNGDNDFKRILEIESKLGDGDNVQNVKRGSADIKQDLLNLCFDVIGYEVDPNKTPFLTEEQADVVSQRFAAETGVDNAKDVYAMLVKMGWVKPAKMHSHTDVEPEKDGGDKDVQPAARDRDRFEDAVDTGTKDVFPSAGASEPDIATNSALQLAKDLIKLGNLNEDEIAEDLMDQFKLTEAQALDVLDAVLISK